MKYPRNRLMQPLNTLTISMMALAVLSSSPAGAQQPASEAGSNAGKLFTTAYEREYLDYLRRNFLAERSTTDFDVNNLPPPIIDDGTEAGEEDTEESEAIVFRFDGAMNSSSGISVWLNGSLQDAADLPEGFVVNRTAAGFELQITDRGQRWTLKPGQVLNITTEEVLESFEYR